MNKKEHIGILKESINYNKTRKAVLENRIAEQVKHYEQRILELENILNDVIDNE